MHKSRKHVVAVKMITLERPMTQWIPISGIEQSALSNRAERLLSCKQRVSKNLQQDCFIYVVDSFCVVRGRQSNSKSRSLMAAPSIIRSTTRPCVYTKTTGYKHSKEISFWSRPWEMHTKYVRRHFQIRSRVMNYVTLRYGRRSCTHRKTAVLPFKLGEDSIVWSVVQETIFSRNTVGTVLASHDLRCLAAFLQLHRILNVCAWNFWNEKSKQFQSGLTNLTELVKRLEVN